MSFRDRERHTEKEKKKDNKKSDLKSPLLHGCKFPVPVGAVPPKIVHSFGACFKKVHQNHPVFLALHFLIFFSIFVGLSIYAFFMYPNVELFYVLRDTA